MKPSVQLTYAKKKKRADMMAHTSNPSTQEAEARGLRVPAQPSLYREILAQEKDRMEGKKRGREGGS
jgi:hypothetical protein